jgi:5-hydroxyisourate hydrolase
MSQITTHILDTALGRPAAGVAIALLHQDGDDWEELGAGISDTDGRVPGLLADGPSLPAGTYRMHFATGSYYEARSKAAFYPYVDVVFQLDDSGDHYHIPLLLSPFGYSTYRGS